MQHATSPSGLRDIRSGPKRHEGEHHRHDLGNAFMLIITQEYERQGFGRTEWADSRWRVGSRMGHINAGDVVLLGVAFVSSGRVMPLLRVEPGFGKQSGCSFWIEAVS